MRPIPRTLLILSLATAASILTLIVRTNAERPRSVHRMQVPGHPEANIEFIKCRAMNGDRGYIVRFSSGAETKEPLVPVEVSVEELQFGARVEFDGDTLIVIGPRGNTVSIAGYVP